MTRVDTLKLYLAQLAADVAAEGKFVGAGSDRAEAAARAILGGAAGMLEALLEDVKTAAGDGGSVATQMITGIASRAVENGIRIGMSKLVGAVTASLDKDKREKRKTGRAIMAAAKKMG
ncbi:MAG: hypothetical protein KGK07_15155 [Chloroflexota bacterium]|nr:hypothetical protein [Chloroflexota bacterium]